MERNVERNSCFPVSVVLNEPDTDFLNPACIAIRSIIHDIFDHSQIKKWCLADSHFPYTFVQYKIILNSIHYMKKVTFAVKSTFLVWKRIVWLTELLEYVFCNCFRLKGIFIIHELCEKRYFIKLPNFLVCVLGIWTGFLSFLQFCFN